jgi:hypothetical protein
VFDSGNSKLVGKGFRHIKLEVVDKTTDQPMPGIAFCQQDFYKRIKAGQPIEICYTIEENTHGSNTFTQLMVKDIRG